MSDADERARLHAELRDCARDLLELLQARGEALLVISSGVVVFNEIPDVWAFAGMALIVGSGLYAIHREARLRNTARTQSPSARRPMSG